MAAKKPLAPLATRVKKDPALLAKALANPGLRAKLPDSYLSASQLAARKNNTYLRDVGDIGTPLSGQSLVNTAQQAVNSEYAPLLSGIGQQEQIVDKSSGIQGDWAKRYYGDLNTLLGGIGGAQATANTNALQGVADRGTATQGAITGADTAAQQRMAADASVRGAGLDGGAGAALAASTAAQQGLAANEQRVAQQSTDNFGQAQAAFLRGLQGSTAQQGGEYQQQITGARAQALAQLAQGRKELEGKQAGSFTDALIKLRGAEQTNAITAAGLGIKQDAAGASADANAGAEGRKYGYTPTEWLSMPASTRTALVAAANKKTAKAPSGYGKGAPGMNKYGYTYDEWTKLSPATQAKERAGKGKGGAAGKPKSGPGSLSSAAEAKIISQVNKAHAALADPSSYQIATVVNGQATYRPAKNAQEVLKALKAKMIDPRVLDVARSLLHNNGDGVGDMGLNAAHDLGIHVNPHWKVIRGGKSKNSPAERAPGGT